MGIGLDMGVAEQVDIVIAPGTEGELGILPHHAPLMTLLKPGELRAKQGAAQRTFAGIDERIWHKTPALKNALIVAQAHVIFGAAFEIGEGKCRYTALCKAPQVVNVEGVG